VTARRSFTFNQAAFEAGPRHFQAVFNATTELAAAAVSDVVTVTPNRVATVKAAIHQDTCTVPSQPGEELVCVMSVLNTGTVGLQHLVANNTACASLPDLSPGQSANCSVQLTAQPGDFDAWDAAYTAATGTSTAPLVLTVAVSAAPTADMPQSSAADTATVSAALVSAPGVRVLSAFTNVSESDAVRAGTLAGGAGQDRQAWPFSVWTSVVFDC
jgi:hypothetical protein